MLRAEEVMKKTLLWVLGMPLFLPAGIRGHSHWLSHVLFQLTESTFLVIIAISISWAVGRGPATALRVSHSCLISPSNLEDALLYMPFWLWEMKALCSSGKHTFPSVSPNGAGFKNCFLTLGSTCSFYDFPWEMESEVVGAFLHSSFLLLW